MYVRSAGLMWPQYIGGRGTHAARARSDQVSVSNSEYVNHKLSLVGPIHSRLLSGGSDSDFDYVCLEFLCSFRALCLLFEAFCAGLRIRIFQRRSAGTKRIRSRTVLRLPKCCPINRGDTQMSFGEN